MPVRVAARPSPRARRPVASGPPASAPRGRAGDVVLYGRSRAAVALVRPVGSNRDPRSELRVAFGNTSGAFGRSRRVVAPPADRAARVRRQRTRRPRARVVRGPRRRRSDRVEVALRRAGRVVRRAAAARHRPRAQRVGRRRAARRRAGRLGGAREGPHAAAASRRGGASGAPRRCAPRRPSPRRCAPRWPSSGRAYVAWSAQRSPRAARAAPSYYEAAVRPAGAARFRRAQLLEQLGAGAQRPARSTSR